MLCDQSVKYSVVKLCQRLLALFSLLRIHIVLLCPSALLVRTEAHAQMPTNQQSPLPVYVPPDFRGTFVRSVLTTASLTPASTGATVQTTAWPSHVSVRTASPVLLVTTLPASRPAPAGPVPTGARVSVSPMEPSGVFARNGLQVPRVHCSTDPRPGRSPSAPGPRTTRRCR